MNPGHWKDLLDVLKDDCKVGLWSKGVELARVGAVVGETRDRDAWILRVRAPGFDVAPTVTLYTDDEEWDCDCDGPFDPCEHAAAAIIAISSAGEDVAELFERREGNGRLRYELLRRDGQLLLQRVLVCGDDPPQLVSSSVSDAVDDGDLLRFEPTHADLAVDRWMGRFPARATVQPERMTTLLRALSGVDELWLDGENVEASSKALLPRARVVDERGGGGVTLILEAHPDVTEIVVPGLLRCDRILHPIGKAARVGRWEKLPLERSFRGDQLGELVGRILPELEREIQVDVESSRLPERQSRAQKLTPWLEFEIDSDEGAVDVLPRLVYGDPPVARIEDGKLVHLRGAVPQRDEAAEQELRHRLREQLNLVPGRRVRLDSGEAARLLSALRGFADGRPRKAGPKAGGETVADSAIDLAALFVPSEETPGELELVFRAADARDRDDAPTVSAASVIAAWREGLSFVPMGAHGLGNLPSGWLEKHGLLVEDLLAARAGNAGAVPRAAAAIMAELGDALDAPPPLEVGRLKKLIDGLGGKPASPALPAGFRGTLRGYQEEGVSWLSRLRDASLGAVLADDMGLGKTVQAACVLSGRTLVVAPRSVIHNWAEELEKFRPDLTVSLFHGPRRKLTDADVTLTTYATLRIDAADLTGIDWDLVVLDEAQAIKNPDSQAARAAYELRANFRLSLSGTPIENRLDELWSQMHFVNPGLLGGRRDFAERYEKPILAGDPQRLTRLRQRIRPFLLRRLKKDVARDLPPRTESTLYCELEAEQRAVYDSVHAATRADMVRQVDGGGSVMQALEALLRLRQAACHAGLLPGREADSSAKVEVLGEALSQAVADGHKALVFSQWTGFLDRVEPELQRREIEFARLDGRTRDRAGVVGTFQEPSGPPVMLISLTAGGTGLNLTAADHVFLLDPWWNPAVEEQAADRAHRIGQDRPVMVYRLVAKDTVEERVLDLQERKREIAESALSEGVGMAGGPVTREEILALLE